MRQLTTEAVIQAWTEDHEATLADRKELPSQEMRLATTICQLLAEGEPVSAAQLSNRTDLPLEQVEAVFAYFAARGGEFNEAGNLVGAALTLNPTAHQITVGDRRLYAWCALDTIFLPGLIGEPATVESSDPVTGERIRLTITPEGVASYSPATTVLSITVPGLSCRHDNSCGPETGPESEACSQMYFFASRETAAMWLEKRPGIAIMTVAEAWRLAKANWLDRRRQLPAPGAGQRMNCRCLPL